MNELDPVTALERRQEIILKKLEGLNKVLEGLKSSYKTSETPTASSGSKTAKRSAGKPLDLVRKVYM